MCLALPARVVDADNEARMATIAIEGVKKRISTALIDPVAPGDYVLVHVGYALNVLSEAEAARTLQLMQEAGLDTATASEARS